MLTDEERKVIEENMCSFGHIVELVSPLFGEPFLHNGYLYYYDGAALTFYPERIGKNVDGGSLRETIEYIAEKHEPRGIIVWGHAKRKPVYDIDGYEVYYQEEIPFIHTELRILNPKPSKKMKKALNRAKREHYVWNIIELNEYRAEWLKLLAETHEEKLGKDELRLVLWYAMYPLSKKTNVLEVRRGEGLVGIQIIYDNSPRYVCLAEIGYNKNVKRATEVVESLAISEYMEKTEILSLGGSPNEGMFRQKIELFKDPELLYANIPYWWIEYRQKGSDWENPWWFERMLKNG